MIALGKFLAAFEKHQRLVRDDTLETDGANSPIMTSYPTTIKEEKDIGTLNEYLSTRSYLEGNSPSAADSAMFAQLGKNLDRAKFPHVARFVKHMAAFSTEERAMFSNGASANTAKPTTGGPKASKDAKAAAKAKMAARPPLPDLTTVPRFATHLSPILSSSPAPPLPGQKSTLITSALPYVNNEPHLGNIIGCVLSGDVYARYCRVRGLNTLYVCGTDEYGTATETKAFEEKTTPAEICERYHKIHAGIYQWFHIAFDSFGRTSTSFQTEIAQGIFKQVEKNNLLVEQETEQLYCPDYDKFLADRYVEGTCPKPACGYTDARGDQCDKCGSLLTPNELIEPHYKYDKNAKITTRKTSHLYLNLPLLQEELTQWMDKAGEGNWSLNTIMVTRSWLRDGLKPRAITRDLKWGTPVPRAGYENKVFYVWFDAPIGYISITAKYCHEVSNKSGSWQDWWHNPENVSLVQFMGKDNIPFHTVIFPCSLLATRQNWTLLDRISTTEYLNYEDGKFSKSRGLGVFGSNCSDTGIPADVWRYFLLSNRPEASDSEFSWNGFLNCNNSELLANLGNFCNRALVFASNSFDGKCPSSQPRSERDERLVSEVNAKLSDWDACMAKQQIRDASKLILDISRLGNVYLQENAPWDLLKQGQEGRAGVVIGLCVQIVAALATVCYPFMPGISHYLRVQLNLGPLIPSDPEPFVPPPLSIVEDIVPAGHQLGEPFTLFDKLDAKIVESFKKKYGGQQVTESNTFDADLRVGRIESLEAHASAENLYILKVDIGSEKRSIVAGLKKHYQPHELEGRRVVIVANLEVSTIKGTQSEGMVLCADKKGAFGILTVADSVPLGTSVLPEGYSAPTSTAKLNIKDFKKLTMKTRDGRVGYKDATLQANGENVSADRVGNSVCTVR